MHLKQTKLKITVTLNYKNLIQFGFVLAENINKVTNIGSVCQNQKNIETGKASNACEPRRVLTSLECFFVTRSWQRNKIGTADIPAATYSPVLLDRGKLCVLENEPPRATSRLTRTRRRVWRDTDKLVSAVRWH